MEYIGTVLKNRAVVNESACVRGYDRVRYFSARKIALYLFN